MLEILAGAPWWISVLISAGAFVAFSVVGADWAKAQAVTQGLAPLLSFAGKGFAALFLLAGSVAFLRRRRRAALLDAQRDLESIRALDWQRFEALVAESYARQGFRTEHSGRAGADGGVDLRLRRAGQVVVVQCKHWRRTEVGVTTVRELYGVMTAEKATGAVVVCSGRFTRDAQAFAAGKPIELVDGAAPARLVSAVRRAPVPNDAPAGAAVAAGTDAGGRPSGIDAARSCTSCSSAMVQRVAKRGAGAGRPSWGCSGFPSCRGVRPRDPAA